ncbi:hypothetical protein [Chryseobacterium sp. KMC2]|uniref:hypothetical protein n=1 Tax=unclassified Chryseobacterium TaxID=2593645 RepID=UPI001924B936|nr:hypothetical protein [Chryseobacterium sp. KMC2]MBL3548854.1 hypothetical protein [Chryseobacterium sp. KMC2]WPO89249.1 hypothetical protein SFA27_13515 [Chryseobacterium sp. HR92]
MNRKWTIVAVIFLSFCVKGQVGINTETPEKDLDINGDISLRREFRVGGNEFIQGDPGQYGQVLVSRGTNEPPQWKFLNIPFLEDSEIKLQQSYAVKDETGIDFLTGEGDGNYIGILDEPLTEAWKKITDLKTIIEVGRAKNKVALFFQTGVEMSYVNGATHTRYICGVFMDNQLKAVRGDQINLFSAKTANHQSLFTLIYTLDNAPVGVHTIEVACRKTFTDAPTASFAIGKTASSTVAAITNNFMLKSNLKIDIMEYIR